MDQRQKNMIFDHFDEPLREQPKQRKQPDFELKGSGKNPCDRRFKKKRDIVKYITEGIKTNPRQKTIKRTEMFSMLLQLAESTNEYYDDKEVSMHAFSNTLYSFFDKDELCLEVDKSFYGI